MRGRYAPGARHSFDDPADPWETGSLTDRPSAEDQRTVLANYDAWVRGKLTQAGVTPDNPEYDALMRTIADSDMVGDVDAAAMFEHGHQLPTRKRDMLANAPASAMDEWKAEVVAADELLADYAAIHGRELAADSAGLEAAIAYVNRNLHYHGKLVGKYIEENREDYLADVASAHRAGYGTGRYAYDGADDGRTSGIGSGSYTPDGQRPDHPDNAGGMVSEMRALQKARGWTP
jgi:hypothetical protein